MDARNAGNVAARRLTVRLGVALLAAVIAVAVVAVSPASAATPPAGLFDVTAFPGDMVLNLGWSPPSSDGGSPILGYHILVTGDAAPIAMDTTATNVAVPVMVRGLHPWTVTAFNAIGDGVSDSGTTNVLASPTAVQDASVIAGDQKAFVFYGAPADAGGSYILGCTATASPGGASGNVPGTLRPIEVDGLTNGVSYTFAVVCYNEVSDPPSKYTNFGPPVTVGPAIPGAPPPPAGVTAAAGDHQVTVDWVPWSSTDVTAYVVTPYALGVALPTKVVTAPPVIFGGLPNNVTYRYTVAAVNSAGPGAPSPKSAPVTTTNVPGVPASVSAVGGAYQATVSWTPPVSDGGSAITGYVVTPFVGLSALPPTTVGAVTSAAITGLTHQTYRFKVAATNGAGTGPSTPLSASVTVVTAPNTPSGSATPRKESARVTWSLGDSGGSPVTSVVVTAHPGGQQCTAPPTAWLCTVTGLTAGMQYTFDVVAINAVGSSAAGTTNMVVPWSGSAFHPITPLRVLDSRTAKGGWGSPLTAGAARELKVTGGAIPAIATAVAVNVTVTGGTAGSFVTAWPSGVAQPTASTVNFPAGVTMAGAATVQVGVGGALAFANAVGSVHVIVDVVGYYDDGTGSYYHAMEPQRFLDSRTAVGAWPGPLGPGASRDLQVRATGLLPPTATAVIANVTVTNATAGSYIRVWPSGTTKPNVSSLNFAANQTIANLVTVSIGANGAITFANELGSVDVVVDVVGWFDSATGARFHGMAPVRVLDDRIGLGLTGPWGPTQTRSLAVGGVPPVPLDAIGVVMTLTVTNPTAPTFVTVFPTGSALPTASNLNAGAGQTVANLVVTGLGTGGSIGIANEAGFVDLVADVNGYYALL